MQPQKKSLLLVLPNLHLGGQQRVALHTAEILSDTYDIFFVLFDGNDAVYTPPCQVIDLAIPAVPGRLHKTFNVLRRAAALRKIKGTQKIDFTLSFGNTANLANVLSGHIGKTVINLRGYDSVSGGRLSRFVYAHSDAIVCCAQEMCTAMTRIDPAFGRKTTCLYNPYDCTDLLEKGSEAVSDYTFSAHTIVTHGRLNEIKNYPRLIKAFSLVRAQISDAQLLIIGEGPERQRLEQLISTYHLEDCVTLPGFRGNPFAYLAKASLYVLSSYSEGFPNALVEGMTFLPAVAVDCKTGPREILSDGPCDRICRGWEEAEHGILVQPAADRVFCPDLTEDDRLLAEAMLAVLSDPQKANTLKKKAENRVKDFSYEMYGKRLVEILER